jgi:hypothetical protein
VLVPLPLPAVAETVRLWLVMAIWAEAEQAKPAVQRRVVRVRVLRSM